MLTSLFVKFINKTCIFDNPMKLAKKCDLFKNFRFLPLIFRNIPFGLRNNWQVSFAKMTLIPYFWNLH
jgi:hypothetical protein